jgi:hypothetical protein
MSRHATLGRKPLRLTWAPECHEGQGYRITQRVRVGCGPIVRSLSPTPTARAQIQDQDQFDGLLRVLMGPGVCDAESCWSVNDGTHLTASNQTLRRGCCRSCAGLARARPMTGSRSHVLVPCAALPPFACVPPWSRGWLGGRCLWCGGGSRGHAALFSAMPVSCGSQAVVGCQHPCWGSVIIDGV